MDADVSILGGVVRLKGEEGYSKSLLSSITMGLFSFVVDLSFLILSRDAELLVDEDSRLCKGCLLL